MEKTDARTLYPIIKETKKILELAGAKESKKTDAATYVAGEDAVNKELERGVVELGVKNARMRKDLYKKKQLIPEVEKKVDEAEDLEETSSILNNYGGQVLERIKK